MTFKKYTASELQTSSSVLYNNVLIDGAIIIEHRSRPDMVLIDKDKLDQALRVECYREVLIKELQITKF